MENKVISCTFEICWKHLGNIGVDDTGKLTFPKTSKSPAIYKFQIIRNNKLHASYIGETEILNRRFYHYRAPGPSQHTNIRINKSFLDELANGSVIDIYLITENAWIITGQTKKLADLTKKPVRRALEHTLQIIEGEQDIEYLNR